MAIALGILYSLVVVLHPLIVHLIPAVLLCISGLFTNLVQAICFVCIWPISENAYTRLNGVVKELDWRVLMGLVDWWAGVRILECIEQETSHLKSKANLIFVRFGKNVNLSYPMLEMMPILPGTGSRSVKSFLAQWSGLLGSSLAVIKASARYSPVIGWSMWICECVISRSCVHDASKLKSALKDFPRPFWLSVVLERTGFTQGDLRAAQRLPVPSKVLSSDTKDLAYAVRRAVIKGGPSVVHVYIKPHVTEKWPETDDAVEKWCTEILAAKDALFDKHIAEHTFDDKGLQAIGRPPKCFLVVISAILLWALKLNFVCRSTLLVSSAAFFTSRMLDVFGCGVLSMLQCLMGAAIANIIWSDHLKLICEVLMNSFFECVLLLDLCLD
ncbi:hypothetical protein ACLB2K_055013 [Fragaria x ananassa]